MKNLPVILYSGKYSKWAFSILHNPNVHIIEFVICCLLMGLAIIEEPTLINIPACSCCSSEGNELCSSHTQQSYKF